jgi:hypothetical protein
VYLPFGSRHQVLQGDPTGPSQQLDHLSRFATAAGRGALGCVAGSYSRPGFLLRYTGRLLLSGFQ